MRDLRVVPFAVRAPVTRAGLAACLLVLAIPAAASAQAPRTWVSGLGDDASPCSRTAPCKTFQGAISRTASGGEIDVLDSGGFGTLTISQPLTIRAQGTVGAVLAAGTNGIVIAAGPSDKVILAGLDINGVGQSVSPGINGVRVLSAGSVRIESSKIYGFTQNGIDFQPTTANTKLSVINTTLEDNANDGLLLAPNGGSGSAVLTNDTIDGNGCGLAATTLGTGGATCGTAGSGSAAGSAQITAINSSVINSTATGVLSNGAGSQNAIGRDLITGNGIGLQPLNGGSILSLGGNVRPRGCQRGRGPRWRSGRKRGTRPSRSDRAGELQAGHRAPARQEAPGQAPALHCQAHLRARALHHHRVGADHARGHQPKRTRAGGRVRQAEPGCCPPHAQLWPPPRAEAKSQAPSPQQPADGQAHRLRGEPAGRTPAAEEAEAGGEVVIGQAVDPVGVGRALARETDERSATGMSAVSRIASPARDR